ncbi:MAG: Ni,Fe-hydrogenase III small subunit [Thermoclostridium sp.]|nr:Ni,Fe-hydrogenase III small subunit [Thermoclostridium sp.]
MGWLDRFKSRSISLLAIQAGGCTGCALQFSMALSLENDIKGITITANPKHADVLLITGCINEQSREEILKIYQQIPQPKAVIAAGACSCSGSLFRTAAGKLYTAEEILPIDAWIRGCAPKMHEMLEAVVRAAQAGLEKEESGMEA